MAEKAAKISFEEAMELMSDIARNGEGADKFRALKLVMSQETSGSVLPDPLNDSEVIDRLARLMKATGPTASQMAYRRAFPHSSRPVTHAAPKVKASDIPPIDKDKLPKNLRELYRMFPEIKKPGIPMGYPAGSGLAVKKEWCNKQAIKMLIDREQSRVDMIAVEEASNAPVEE